MPREQLSYKGTRNPVFTTHRADVANHAMFDQAERRAYAVDEISSALGGGEGSDDRTSGTDHYEI